MTRLGTLAAYPGCLHWHYQSGQQAGTLELTWWPAERRLWVKVARNRRAAWVDAALLRLVWRIQASL